MPDVWPFMPLKASREILSFETDVLQAYSAESRVSLRGARQIVEYDYALTADEYTQAEKMVRDNPIGFWLVPIWHEVSDAGAVANTDTIITCDTNADYSGQALVYGACNDYVAVTVTGTFPTQITISDPVGQDYASADCMPLKTAYAHEGLQVRRRVREYYECSMTFHVYEMPDLAATQLPQYESLDYFNCAGAVIEPLSGSVREPSFVVDNGFGPIVVEPERSVVEGRFSMSMASSTAAKRYERKQWLYLLRGKDRPFWIPSWGGALTLIDPVGSADTSILVGPKFTTASHYVGRHIRFPGDVFREVTAAADESGNHRLDITATGVDFATTDIPRLISQVRLDTDTIQIDHVRGFVGRTQVSLFEV